MKIPREVKELESLIKVNKHLGIALSELTNFIPNEVSAVLPTINDLPDPGPPARNTALKIDGSLRPS